MDITFDETPAGAQIAIRLTTQELEALGRGSLTVTLPVATQATSGIAQLLLARGADPFRLDADGVSMLDAARKMGALDTMELLAAATNER